ncbi:tail fiber domain-containing protein, partial [Patescibacteria group bacterium]|nr:tail fiber domain-containing protein [Patescibacteria group bacterium]
VLGGSSTDTKQLVIKAGGNIGIGTTAPGAKLEIIGAGTGATFSLRLKNSAGADKISFLDNGSIGIGTTDPGSAKLKIEESKNGQTFLQVSNPSTDISASASISATNDAFDYASLGMFGSNYSAYETFVASRAFIYNTGTNGLAFINTDTSAPFIFANNTYGETELLRITGDGNIGIGTTSPSGILEVFKSSTGRTRGSLLVNDKNVTIGVLSSTGGDSSVLEVVNRVGALVFKVDTNAQRVGIGTTTPAYKFQVVVDASNEGHVDSTGAWARSSDLRYKQNITSLENSLDLLLQTRPVRYDSMTEILSNPGEGRHIGFIAQELELLFPEVVGTDSNGYKSIAYEALAPVLSQAIKEQQIQIVSLSNQLLLDADGRIIISENEDGTFTVEDDKGNIFDRILAANIAFIADLKTGLIETKKLIADSIETKELVSPVIETEKINLGQISPLADEDIVIDLERPTQEASESSFGKLIVKGENGNTVASIDSSGDAQFAGKLESDSLETNDATIAGVLTVDEIKAKRISAEQIVGFEGYFDSLLSASTSVETEEITDDASALSDEELALPDEIEALINKILSENSSSSTSSAQVNANTFIPDYSQSDEQTSLQSLAVYGFTSLADTTISGYLSIDGTLVLSGNSIDSLSDTLYINPMALASINIMAGKIIIDTNGNALFKENLTVEGTLAVNEIAPLKESDVSINLANNFDEQKAASGFGKLLVKGEKGNITASIDASGSAKFASLSLVADYSATESGSLIAAGETEEALGIDAPSLKTNASTGIATLPRGETEILIYNSHVSDQSLIYVTPITATDNKVLFVKAKKANTKDNDGYFRVAIDRPINHDITFNFWIIGSSN